MTRNILKLFIMCLLPVVLLSASCKKEQPKQPTVKEEEMPPYTETGANTFACKVNGKVWRAKGDFLVNSMSAWYSNVQKALGLNGFRNSETVGFQPFQNVTEPSEFIIGEETGNIAHYEINTTYPPKRYYLTKDGYGGKLILKKLDTINHICSGTFYFDAASIPVDQNDTTYKKGEVVHITEGQFDFKYKR